MATLSIVIPVYNVVEYIDECMESIVSQGQNDYEIILVDDGSTDGSGTKCDLWAEKQDCIRVIHKSNGGLSSARNTGLEYAEGSYVLFVDSDDRISSGSIEKIQKYIDETKADLYFLSGKKFYLNGKEEALDDPIDRDSINGKMDIEVLKYISAMTRYPGSACTKAYKRQYLDRNNLRFPSDQRIAEDLGFTLRCLLTAESFDVVECEFYEYRQSREGSITSNSTAINKSFWNLATFLLESIDLLSVNKEPRNAKCKYALGLVAYEYTVALVHYWQVTEQADEANQLMKELTWLKQYLVSRRGRIISAMLGIFGIKTTSRLLAWAYDSRERNNGK